MRDERSKVDNMMVLAGVVLLGSIWGLLESTIGGLKWSVGGLYISMGAVMAGTFGLMFMIFAKRTFRFTGVVVLVALVAAVLRYFAPVGTVVICSAIAIAAEGLVFELLVSRKVFLGNLTGKKDYRILAFLGVISGFAVFTTGYITTQVLTPVFTGGTLVLMDVVRILPLIIGRSFYAALLGGISVPVIAYTDNLHLDISRYGKGIYFTATTTASLFCWVLVLFILF